MNTIKILDKTPFHKMHIGVGNLPSSYLDSLSYYEQLAFLTDYIVNTVIPKVNENIILTNSLVTEFAEVKELVDKAEKDVAVLTQQVLDLTAELARQIAEAKDYTDTEIDSLSAFLQNMISTRINTLDAKLDSEVARLDDKIEHYPISNVIVQNSIRGYETAIQVYLDDITNLLRRGGITASEYDAIELTATEYDAKEITAYRYDFYGQLELTGSAEVDSIVLYNQTGQNTDGAMTQKAVTDALENAGGGIPALTNETLALTLNIFGSRFWLNVDDDTLTDADIGSTELRLQKSDDGSAFRLSGVFEYNSPRQTSSYQASQCYRPKTQIAGTTFEDEYNFGIDTGLIVKAPSSPIRFYGGIKVNQQISTSVINYLYAPAYEPSFIVGSNGHIYVCVSSMMEERLQPEQDYSKRIVFTNALYLI